MYRANLMLFAWRSAKAGGSRCLHAAVPGGRTEDVARGEAYILSYALVPYELQPSDPANEAIVAQLVHDVLGALRSDFIAARASHWLCREALPVSSRAELEQQLVSDGWQIRGNTAVHPIGKNPGISGYLSMALGMDYDKAITLPKEAPLATFTALAARLLESFPGFPDDRAIAFSRCVETPTPTAPPTSGIQWTAPGAIPSQRGKSLGLTGALGVAPRPKGEREEWEQQFEQASRSPGLGARVTRVR